ncbi:hypothetical protein B0T22DRAFT_531249 [Podospora appendiculata]|uniref:SnoaL-like domain-containing protein n=1 Tax=Podospora appendiculata TaxID=314037 RepID=A0AAE0WY89_9PEZI|nr:hypothetical protein B0T22DRAFT_495230 [Podospora appendiculata]KAK3681354.1 hypothetical protein B0T22DRAFT_531249 [Podospora appendiculata]
MSATAPVQAATLDKFLAAWKSQNAEETVALWSDDFKQRLLPLSLGMPVKMRAEAEVVNAKLIENLTNWKLNIREIVHDAPRSTAAVYATSLADTPLPGEKWTNEYAIFVSFTEDGTKISRLEEMVDTAFYRDLFPKFQKYLATHGGRQEEGSA